MYIVVKDFKCKVTKKFYKAGSVYDGKRAEELQELGYVAEAKKSGNETEWPKHIGGSHYELSNGEKVNGKEAAREAQAAIDQLS